jgi:uncharacterized glyoxalase superfamily protein PhnB
MSEHHVDPFEALRLPATPLAPRPAFAAELRARLRQRLAPAPHTEPTGGAPVTETDADPRTQTLTPYLCARGAEDAIGFYRDVFGAALVGEVYRDPDDGRIGHAELSVGATTFYLADEYEALGVLSPSSRGGTTVSFVLLVDDVDATWAAALDRGATPEREITVAHGMRAGWLKDPWGHRWNVGELLER